MFGLEAKVLWLFVFVALYWSYCIYWGIKGKTIKNSWRLLYCWKVNINLGFRFSAHGCHFLLDFYGSSSLIYRDGFHMHMPLLCHNYTFYRSTILKRQWMIVRNLGFNTREMFSNYFRSDTIRILVVLVALVFSVPYLGIQLQHLAFFNVLTDQMFDVTTGMILLSLVVIICCFWRFKSCSIRRYYAMYS